MPKSANILFMFIRRILNWLNFVNPSFDLRSYSAQRHWVKVKIFPYSFELRNVKNRLKARLAFEIFNKTCVYDNVTVNLRNVVEPKIYTRFGYLFLILATLK